jgi:hypothetical protein
MALPFIVVSFTRSNGVVDEWSDGKIAPDTPQVRPTRALVVRPSGFSKPFSHLQTIAPLLPQWILWHALGPLPGGSAQSHVLWAWILYWYNCKKLILILKIY